MKLDLSHEDRDKLENALDLLYEQIDMLSEQKDELLYKCKGEFSATKLYLGEQAAELVVLINKLKQAQFALKELS